MSKPRGPHRANKLNDKAVKAAGPGYHGDGAGLYLFVDPSGVGRRWFLRITVHGRRREIGLGGYPTVKLAEARDEARELRKVAKTGGDPLAVRRQSLQREGIPTFRAAAKRVHTGLRPNWKNMKHAEQWIASLEAYVFPTIGDQRVNEIHRPDILSVLSPIWLAKPETARRVRQRVAAILDWAKVAGYREGDNPVDGVTKGLPRQIKRIKHHTAMPYAEVPQFVADLRSMENSALTARLAFEFLILTAGRTREVLEARQDEINADDQMWTVPSQRMKAKREHRVPLSDRCLEILSEAQMINQGSPYVFPGMALGKPLSNMTLLMLLRRMGVAVTVHGFRSSFRDWAQERTLIPREVCERALAHAIAGKAEAAYARSDLFERRRELMSAWAAFVTDGGAKIIPLPVAADRA